MNLVFIYGPPASGKLTVATELAKITGYKVFHNHLTIDVAKALYPNFDAQMYSLVRKLRVDTIAYAAEQGTNLIFTYVYSGDGEDTNFVNSVVHTVESQGGIVLFVQLTADKEILISRADNESRKQIRKLIDKTELAQYLSDYDYNATVSYGGVLRLDTATASPLESAQSTVAHFKLELTQT